MNFTGRLDSADLTTVAAVREHFPGKSTADDALIASIITGVSGQIADYLGRHIRKAQRVEEYAVKPGSRMARIDGYPMTLTETAFPRVKRGATMKIARAQEFVDFGDSEFAISPDSGIIRFANAYPETSYLIVDYEGGFVADGEDPLAVAPAWLTMAARIQSVYLLQRYDRLGGNVEQFAGGGTQFVREYGLVDHTREMLDAHRRVA